MVSPAPCRGREIRGAVLFPRKENSPPYTPQEKGTPLPACGSKGCGAWGVEVLCVAALLRSPPLALLYDLTCSYYPLPLC